MKREEKKISERELTAYHEAGHVVAAFRFGHSHGFVSIVPNPATGTAGHSCCEDSDVPEEMVIQATGRIRSHR